LSPLKSSKTVFNPPWGISRLTAFSKNKIIMTYKSKKSKFFYSAALFFMAASSAFAQGDGAAGITEATQMVTSYFDPATKLIYAAGAIIGLIGGVKVYSKFSSGDPDTGKTAASWFGACIFLIVAATILRSFFL
jgi:hypothetical protein